MKRTRHLQRAVASVVALGLIATACGDDDADTAEPATSEAQSEAQSDDTEATDAPPADSAATSDLSGELEVFSWWTSGSEDSALQALLGAFSAAAPGVEIVNGAVAGGGGANAQAVLATRVQGNDAPDTWQAGPGGRMAPYLEADQIRPVTEVFDEQGFGDVMPAGLIDSLSSDGEIYAVPTGAHRGNNLWYNSALLEQAGVAIPDGEYGLDQFITDLGTLDAAGIIPLCLGAKDAFAVDQLFENTLLGVVGTEGWAALRDGERSWDDPEVREAADYFARMLPYVDPDSSALTWNQAILRLAEGQCAFNSMGDWAYGELLNAGAADGTDFGYVNHPGTDGEFMLVVDAFVAAKDTPNWDAVKVWMAAIGQPEAQLEFNRFKGSSPVRSDVDVSSLPPYQQGATADLAVDPTALSIVHHGDPQFQTALSEAITTFVQTQDVDSFIQSLASS